MPEFPAYAVLGSGRWAARIAGILTKENRRTQSLRDTQPHATEAANDFKNRLCLALKSSGAACAWLCDPPGPAIPWLIESALRAGLHVIAEKPWRYAEETQSLMDLAQKAGRVTAIHYEYCLLEAVEGWRRDFSPGTGIAFGGRFFLNRADGSGIAALENLGSHLMAIRAYAVPESRIIEIEGHYERPDERRVWIEKRDGARASIDFASNKEPIIQRFISRFEAALAGEDFPFDLAFAQRVSRDIAALR